MLLFQNGRVVLPDGSFALLDVLVKDGKIVEIGQGLPAQGRVVDAAGLLLAPGCVDAHCHIGIIEQGVGAEGSDVNEMSDPVTPQLRAIDGINPRCQAFREAYEAGVTTVAVGPGSANVVGGQFAILKTCGEVVDDMVVKEPSAMKCAFGENPKKVYGGQKKAPMTRMAGAAILRELLLRTRNYAQALERAEAEGKAPPPFDMKLDAMLPVIRGEMPVKMHAHRVDDIFTAIRIAKEFQLKFTIEHCTEGHLAAQRLKKEIDVALVGPSFGSRSKYELREKSFVTPGALHAAGIRVAIITDAPVVPLQHLQLCAGLAVKAGMPEAEAWRAITINPAEILGIGGRLGSIETGKDADLALYRGNPLRDIDCETVMTVIDGKVVYER